MLFFEGSVDWGNMLDCGVIYWFLKKELGKLLFLSIGWNYGVFIYKIIKKKNIKIYVNFVEEYCYSNYN